MAGTRPGSLPPENRARKRLSEAPRVALLRESLLHRWEAPSHVPIERLPETLLRCFSGKRVAPRTDAEEGEAGGFCVLRRRSLAKTVSQVWRCSGGTCEGRTGRSGCSVYSFLGCIMSSTKCALCPQLMLGTGRMCSPSAQRHNREFEHRSDSVG